MKWYANKSAKPVSVNITSNVEWKNVKLYNNFSFVQLRKLENNDQGSTRYMEINYTIGSFRPKN